MALSPARLRVRSNWKYSTSPVTTITPRQIPTRALSTSSTSPIEPEMNWARCHFLNRPCCEGGFPPRGRGGGFGSNAPVARSKRRIFALRPPLPPPLLAPPLLGRPALLPRLLFPPAVLTRLRYPHCDFHPHYSHYYGFASLNNACRFAVDHAHFNVLQRNSALNRRMCSRGCLRHRSVQVIVIGQRRAQHSP